MKLRLGLSPCPNDTFIFHALIHGLVGPAELEVEPVFADVEELNERMLAGDLEVTKGSFAALAATRDRYAVLRTGGALGRGNYVVALSACVWSLWTGDWATTAVAPSASERMVE